jgi:hypothetical protein
MYSKFESNKMKVSCKCGNVHKKKCSGFYFFIRILKKCRIGYDCSEQHFKLTLKQILSILSHLCTFKLSVSDINVAMKTTSTDSDQKCRFQYIYPRVVYI